MATAAKKITLAASRDIPLNMLVLSQANVRRVKAGVSIEELAEDIARRGLLQGLSVRPIVGEDGTETEMFEIPAGGRRFRALELLVKQKRMSKTTPVPCVVRETGIPEEDSLAENVQRAPLHPLDQFRAFQALRDKGQAEEEIAAAFFVPVSVVRQRLKLASVSPNLLAIYAEDGLTLDQLMAFTVSGDHERQEQVFDRLTQTYDRQPYATPRSVKAVGCRRIQRDTWGISDDIIAPSGASATSATGRSPSRLPRRLRRSPDDWNRSARQPPKHLHTPGRRSHPGCAHHRRSVRPTGSDHGTGQRERLR